MKQNISKKERLSKRNLNKMEKAFSKYLSKGTLKIIAQSTNSDDQRERDMPIDKFTQLVILGNSLGKSLSLKCLSDAALEWNIVDKEISPQRISQQIDERGNGYFKALFEHLLSFALHLPRRSRRKVTSCFKSIDILDASNYHLCYKLFSLYRGKRGNAGMKIHTRFNLDYLLPMCVVVSDGKSHDNAFAPYNEDETGILYIIDRGYTDYKRYRDLIASGNDFVTRKKSNICARVVLDLKTGKQFPKNVFLEQLQTQYLGEYDLLIELSTGLRLRLIRYYDEEADEYYDYLTSLLDIDTFSSQDIRLIYKDRWQIEIFFRDLKYVSGSVHIIYQTDNRIKAQLYASLCYYLIVRIFILIASIETGKDYYHYSFKYSARLVKLGFIKWKKEQNELQSDLVSLIICDIINKGKKAF